MPSAIPTGTPRHPDSLGLVHHQMALRPPNHRSEKGALNVSGLADHPGRSGAILAGHRDLGSAETPISDNPIDKHVVKYCIGVGTGLGKVKNKKRAWARLKADLSEPLVDTSVSFAAYMALDQDAKLVKKRAPGNWLAAHFTDGRRKLDHQLFRSMIIFDLDYITVAQGSRRQTVTEVIADVIAEWLDTPLPASEIVADDSGFGDENAGDEPMVRNMVTARDCYEALREAPLLASYRQTDMRTFGKALKLLGGWVEIGKVRRHGRPPTVWFVRSEDGPLWVPEGNVQTCEIEPGFDDLLS